jgi:hypothetical protein
METECPGNKGAYDKRGAITVANQRYKKEHKKLSIYPCGDHWHVTHHLHGNWKRNRKDNRDRKKMPIIKKKIYTPPEEIDDLLY